jgi:hypothetical protein
MTGILPIFNERLGLRRWSTKAEHQRRIEFGAQGYHEKELISGKLNRMTLPGRSREDDMAICFT